MVEAFLLNCLQSNFIISRIRFYEGLTPEQKVELIREVRMVTRKDCPRL
jgi:hypothetical protein